MTREYKVNEFITLKLENNETNIYIKDRLFTQCKFLLLNIPGDNLEEVENISSIDEAEVYLSHAMEEEEIIIDSETEFFGHCSNLQAWAENNYDTRLLHSNLAFPLLKELVDARDPKAHKVFKEEIAVRITSGIPSTILFLIKNDYLSYLNDEEIQTLFDGLDFSVLTQYKTRDFHAAMQELSDLGLEAARKYYFNYIYSGFFELNSLGDILDLFSGKFLSHFTKKEFLKFAPFLLKEFEQYAGVEPYFEVMGYVFVGIHRYQFEEDEEFPFASTWRSLFSQITQEEYETWSDILWNLVPTTNYHVLVPVFILSFIHIQTSDQFGDLSHILNLFWEQLENLEIIYQVGSLYINLLSAINNTPHLTVFSKLLRKSLQYLLISLKGRENIANSTLVSMLSYSIHSLQDGDVRNMLIDTFKDMKKMISKVL